MPPISVRDVLRLALPPSTIVAAGAVGLAHQVTWVTTLRATLPAFVNLRGGELALIPVAAAQALDERLTLVNLIERLAHVPVAAIAAIGDVSIEARQSADAARIPLLHLPDDTDPREVEREVQRLIGDYEAQLDRRAAQLGEHLAQRSIAGVGLNGLLEILAERTGQGVGCYSAVGELRMMAARGPARVALQTLHPTEAGSSTHLGRAIWSQPIGSPQDRMGFLALAGDTQDDWDRLAAQKGAGVLALELAKEQAVQAAEERLRGDFVQAVLAGIPTDSEALMRRGQELGYELRRPHVAMLCSVGEASSAVAAQAASLLNTTLASMKLGAPTMRRADGALAYLPLTEEGSRPRELAEKIHAQMAHEMPDVVLALGREAPNVATWPRSLREAEQALMLGRQLLDNARVLDFGDLGVYRLLALLRESSELWDFYRTTLATLADYDRNQDAELLKTLDAFFANLGNLTRTAEALHVHRNTLLYRLGRITEISGFDLDNAEERLSLWIALKAHRVLQTLDEFHGGS